MGKYLHAYTANGRLSVGRKSVARRYAPYNNTTRRSSTRRMQQMRFRTKGARSSKRKNQRRSRKSQSMFEGTSKFVYRYGKRRRIRTKTAPLYLYRNSGGRITGTEGLQTVNNLLEMYDYNDLVTIDNQLPSGSNQYTVHNGGKLRVDFTNQSQAPVEIKLYHVLTKKDQTLGNSPRQLWDDGLSSQTGATDPHTFLGATPYKSQQFTQFYKIKRTTKFVLAPGGNHTVYVNANVYTQMREARFRTGLNLYFAGLTYTMLAVMRGFPLNDSTTTTDVTTAAVAVDYIWNKTYDFTYLERQSQGGSMIDSLDHTVTPRTVFQMDGDIGTVMTS